MVLIGKSNRPELKKSREIIQRVYQRDLYKCIGEVAVPIKNLDQFFSKIFTLENIISYHDGSPDELSEKDLTIRPYNLNYGFGLDNPIDNVKFFTEYEIIEEN